MKSRMPRLFEHVSKALRSSAPYVLLEIVLPGGTLFALLLLIYQNRHRFAVSRPRPFQVVVAQAPGRLRPKLALVVRRDRLVSAWRGHQGTSRTAQPLPLARAA